MYGCIPRSTSGYTPELQKLEELWTTLRSLLICGRWYPPSYLNVEDQIATGLALGLITAPEAEWLEVNAYWIAPAERADT